MRFDGNLFVPLSVEAGIEIIDSSSTAAFSAGFGPRQFGNPRTVSGFLRAADAIAQGRATFPESRFAVVHIRLLPVILLPADLYEVNFVHLYGESRPCVVISPAGVEAMASRIHDDAKPHADISMKVYGPAGSH